MPDTPSPYPIADARRTYAVVGMTCEHCAMSIREEVGEVAGVTGVEVDLASGRMVVTGGDDAAIRAAVADAGYEAVVP